ncbi:DUF4832 domain-containing protein [Noviherbaspirillum sp. CPCC 100848]|uniref:DUF4832 domain-containing protein n=1 Tax=Noviherbaspirillum album TaxID=3080276 RepID=A0ABU6J6X8_9BURK|nr:DUF4832 domain-containing protein [Noviherbaspirillum sp. CPCC 100848]MEC4719280.1 DUF4832 domain-containing protein [Noviherbaspirillum sp. CPCC 100848]
MRLSAVGTTTFFILLPFWSGAGAVSDVKSGRADASPFFRKADLVSREYRPARGLVPNPERGWYYSADCDGKVAVEQLKTWRNREGITLAVCSVGLGEFISKEISPAALENFSNNMSSFRAAGMKAILRFSYSSDISGIDANLPRIRAHMDQLKPYLEKHKDVIAVVHAGFVGGWGEWAYSRNFGNLGQLSEANWRDRKAVVDKLLAVVPKERIVQLRTPAFKRRFAGEKPLQPGEAYGTSARARLGHHNDCFLASANDWGTYTDRTVEYPYLQEETAYVAMGGETCNLEPQRSNCKNALDELGRFHYSYLNASYHPEVLKAFKQEGCYGVIENRLGYRFVLQRAAFPKAAQAGGVLSFELAVQNDGWAAPFNQRDVELVLRNRSTRALTRLRVETEIRHWRPGATTRLRQAIPLPETLPQGRYELLLNFPDAAPGLRNRPDYSIRLAHEDGWESETGFNRLHHNLEIKGAVASDGLRKPSNRSNNSIAIDQR